MTTEGPGGARPLRLEAIVLAGGAGVRFGGRKLTTVWRGGRLIDGALAAAFGSPARSVTVVTGADPAVGPAAEDFASRVGQARRLKLAHAKDHAEGMGASLRTGMDALPVDAEGVFVFLGDMPSIPADIAERLADAFRPGLDAAAPLYAGKRGHPILFGASLFPVLRASAGDQGARAALKSLGARLATVETSDPGVLFDVDVPESP